MVFGSELFHRNFIEISFGPFDIDLFVTSINIKCPCFVSWLPLDYTVNAFSLNWNKFYFYAFPPFILILRVLPKITEQRGF